MFYIVRVRRSFVFLLMEKQHDNDVDVILQMCWQEATAGFVSTKKAPHPATLHISGYALEKESWVLSVIQRTY